MCPFSSCGGAGSLPLGFRTRQFGWPSSRTPWHDPQFCWYTACPMATCAGSSGFAPAIDAVGQFIFRVAARPMAATPPTSTIATKFRRFGEARLRDGENRSDMLVVPARDWESAIGSHRIFPRWSHYSVSVRADFKSAETQPNARQPLGETAAASALIVRSRRVWVGRGCASVRRLVNRQRQIGCLRGFYGNRRIENRRRGRRTDR